MNMRESRRLQRSDGRVIDGRGVMIVESRDDGVAL
jgi:hypothetical protein